MKTNHVIIQHFWKKLIPQHQMIHQKTPIPHKQSTGAAYTRNSYNKNQPFSLPEIETYNVWSKIHKGNKNF